MSPPHQTGGEGEDGRWQPISTAPKDGTSVLVTVSATPTNTTFPSLRNVFQAAFEGGAWISLGFDRLENKFWEVTHWQPLPEPPEQGQ